MSPAPNDGSLTRLLYRAVAEHFGPAGPVDPEQVALAGCTVVGRTIAAVPDPIARGVLLAQAQWTLGRTVAEVVKAGRARGKGGRPDGT